MKKKQISILVGIAVTAVVAIGATLAFLHSTTETKTNTFSSDKNISIQLREPAWDGYGFDSKVEPDGSSANPEYQGDKLLGVNEAKAYVPGQTIYKNPTVKNSGDKNNGVNAYVAIKVQYFDYNGENNKENQISYDAFKKAFLDEQGINFSNKWSKISEDGKMNQIYLYGVDNIGSELSVESTTEELFTEVPISLDLQPGKDGKLPGFNIKIQAYAIQSTGIDEKNAAEALLNFIGQN
ncbi:hypothetical protein [Eubacterium sp. 1001713B170207_170306_E7]|uniref:hypothetical protein n=1 Tax=Eubacterium sp. 1001713B170207_170306_E7 TaxID=2787097 RepID=UPI00189B3C06|nr:hypothetical protein [Eubacterium sp. 1001713B170207_170306_E7]